MKLCSSCDNSPLPFLMVLMVASTTAFMTWLIVGLSIPDTLPRATVSGLAFLAVGGTLLHYVLTCLKRHCPHERGHSHRPHLRNPVPSGGR